MSWHRRLSNLFRNAKLQRDLERELSFHVAERADDLQRSGLNEADAARAARARFGNFTSQMERTRAMDIHSGLESAARNVKYALRALAKSPGFAFTIVATLALGIGANSAVFSAVDAVLLRPLPFPDAGRLVEIPQWRSKIPEPWVSPARVEDWNRLNNAFEAITGYDSEDLSEISGALPERLKHELVAPRFLETLGIAPEAGRDFSPQEERFGGAKVVLISSRFCRRRFASPADALGRTLRFSGAAYTIVGVMPPSFEFPDRDADLWTPQPPDAPYAQDRDAAWYTVIGRLQPGVTLARAKANLAAVQAGLARRYPKTDAPISVSVVPLKDVITGPVRKSLWLLFGSVTLLLLIACANIAALLLSRAIARRHEISLRFSLGASRASVAAQFLTEAGLLAFTGAALGLFAAAAAGPLFRALAKDLPRIGEIALNGRIVLYSLVCAAAATLLCGLFPAMRGARRGLASSLAHGGRAGVAGRNPLQFLLAGVQVALAVTLLSGAGLLARSFEALARVSPGFDARHVLAFQISSTWAESKRGGTKQRTERILDGLRALPGVANASVTDELPGVPGEYGVELKLAEGRAETEPKMFAQARTVSPAYFATMGIPLLSGELCRNDANATMVMINRSFADRYLKGAAAIGEHLAVPGVSASPAAGIRGIVGDARESGLERAPSPTAYWCDGALEPDAFFLVRTRANPDAMAATIRREIHDLEPQRSVYDLAPLTAHISGAYAEDRLRTVLLAFFALTAIALACVGLYGTLSYSVNTRRREVALRMALGALRGQVACDFLGQGLLVSALGCLAGLALAVALGRALSGMLYGVSAADPLTLAAVAGIVLAVSALASLVPALRAARVQPMQALREE